MFSFKIRSVFTDLNGQPLPRALLLLSALSLTGCFSPIALEHVAIAYNESTADVVSKQLLLNIARASQDQPIYFAGISNIAATLNFQANMGVGGVSGGTGSVPMLPSFGGSVAENPTISIVPIEGEEFTQRMLTPLSEKKLALLLRQNLEVDLLLRLVTLEFRTQGEEGVYHNRPRNLEDYAAFRRMVLHLSSIQDRDKLFAEPLIFEQTWTLPAAMVSGKDFQALEQGYHLTLDAKQQQYHLTKEVVGRTVLTNYDPALLSNQERSDLNDEASRNADNEVLVDIRPGHQGGEYPIHGKFRLRSFSNIMYFIGRSISNEPEVDVSQDPNTPAVSENPISVLSITASDTPPTHSELVVNYRNKYYSLTQNADSVWNQTAFRVLSQIYQMTVTDLPKSAAPSITISK
jgi:hypothetical protein